MFLYIWYMKTFEQFNKTEINLEIRFDFWCINKQTTYGLYYFYKNDCVLEYDKRTNQYWLSNRIKKNIKLINYMKK